MNRLQDATRWCWRLFGLGMAITLAVTLWDYSGRWHTPGYWLRNLVMHGLYWGPRIAGPFLLLALMGQVALMSGWGRFKAALAACFVLLGLWASLIEPGWVRMRETRLAGLPSGAQPLRLAVVADLHWGLFFRDLDLRRLVQRLNALEVDAVLVAGDWTHEPPLNLHAGFAPLAAIRHPVLGVLGNHDTQAPGPDLTLPLRAALKAHGVQLIEGQAIPFKGWELVGLEDLWGGRPQFQIRSLWPDKSSLAPNPPRIVVVHQPDTLTRLPAHAAFLSVAGHTHGGQVWIPGFTPWWLLNTNGSQPWWNGLYDTPAGRLFVTPGLGTIGVPARLAVRPTIDVIHIGP